MAKDKAKAELGDTVELADKETSFYDPETQLDLSRDGTAELKERIGKKTHTAIVSGRLLVVGGKKRMLGAGDQSEDAAGTRPPTGGKKKKAADAGEK